MRHRLSDGMMWTLLLAWTAAAALPVYARIVRHYAGRGVALGVGGRLAALAASALAGVLAVCLIMAALVLIAVAADFIRSGMRRRGKTAPEHDGGRR